jgi:AraC-like DNA-binding protein
MVETPRSPQAHTPIAYIRAMVLAYHRRQLDPRPALLQAQISPASLFDPHAKVTALQMETMSAAAMRELDDEALGWFGRRLPWGSYGMLVRASMPSGHLGLAMSRWCRHHGLLTEDIRLTLGSHKGVAWIELEEHIALGDAREFCIVSVLRNALGVACWLCDSRIPLMGTSLRFAAPAHESSYAVLFDGETTFSASHNRIFFDAAYLQLPIRRDDAALQRMLERALQLTVRPYRRDRLLAWRVRQALQEHVALFQNVERLATHLQLSTRSLHRQLQEEGSSLQAIKDSIRLERAKALLAQTDKPIKQIAAQLGFGNAKSFIHAFRQWNGVTPGAWRTQAENAELMSAALHSNGKY